jgi:hypothetical protein
MDTASQPPATCPYLIPKILATAVLLIDWRPKMEPLLLLIWPKFEKQPKIKMTSYAKDIRLRLAQFGGNDRFASDVGATEMPIDFLERVR